MSRARLDDRLVGSLLTWWHGRPAWQQVLLVYALTRVFAFVVVDRTARFQVASLWTAPHPSYLDMIDNWDGDWYRRIAEYGYPAVLPRTSLGQVRQNQWAFYPLYPFLSRGVQWATGLGWSAAASLVALAAGAGAVVVMRSLVERVAGPALALWTVILFCCFPTAPVLQFTYTESLAVLLLVSVLHLVHDQRYLLGIPVVVLLALERPIGAPVAAVIALHVLRSWRRDSPGRRTMAAQLALVLAAAGAVLLWPIIAGVATADPRAYAQTMAAWRSDGAVVLFWPWWSSSRYVLGAVVGPLVLLLVLALTAVWLTRPGAKAVAGDLRAWVVCYLGYLLAVLDPSTSLPRYLFLAFPFGTMTAAASSSRAYRAVVAASFLAGQIVWVAWLWRFSPPSDSPP